MSWGNVVIDEGFDEKTIITVIQGEIMILSDRLVCHEFRGWRDQLEKSMCGTDIKTSFPWYSAFSRNRKRCGCALGSMEGDRAHKIGRHGNGGQFLSYSLQSIPWMTRP